METRRNFLFAYGANRFYQGVSFTEDINGPEEYPRSVIKLFFIKHLAALTRWVYLSDCRLREKPDPRMSLQVVLLSFVIIDNISPFWYISNVIFSLSAFFCLH